MCKEGRREGGERGKVRREERNGRLIGREERGRKGGNSTLPFFTTKTKSGINTKT